MTLYLPLRLTGAPPLNLTWRLRCEAEYSKLFIYLNYELDGRKVPGQKSEYQGPKNYDSKVVLEGIIWRQYESDCRKVPSRKF